MTYYGQGGVACGDTYDDTTYTAAISRITYDAWPGASASTNRNPVCGPFVDGRYFLLPFTVHIVDRCEACAPGDIDLAPAAFLKLTVPQLDTSGFALGDYMAEASKNALGRVPVTWKFDEVQTYGQVRGQKKEGCWGGCVADP
ncbi:hypothetical protein AURDEDRAFT_85526 [Auricularia subglabra TFB-10046 SS5]|nr:hypothetical protein AURDEDRAFT_85526 [Auricularia subglabra TFB-10046 SS5]